MLHQIKVFCKQVVLESWNVKVKLFSRVWLFVTPWTVAYQAPPSMEFSRQEYWSGVPFPSPGDLPDPGIKPGAIIRFQLFTGFFPSLRKNSWHIPLYMFKTYSVMTCFTYIMKWLLLQVQLTSLILYRYRKRKKFSLCYENS